MKSLTRILLTGACGLLLAACSAVTDDTLESEQPHVSNHYINFAISVTGSEGPVTRALPAGGEDGDGREIGFDRENAVTGITLILYQGSGITADASTKIDFVAYYPVTKTTKDDLAKIEATYETGNQLVPHNTIDFTKTYHAVVVANDDLTGSITPGSSTLGQVRELTLSKIYSGDETKTAEQCVGFVMSSKEDRTFTFSSVTPSELGGGDKLYDLTGFPVLIERLAARIDFWAVNGTYNSSVNGYVYDVSGSSTDKFVVTGIVPFNLTNGHGDYGKEYLLKRLTASLSSISPLWYTEEVAGAEGTGNYVLDPMTKDKVTAEHPSLTNSLESIKDLASFSGNGYYKTVSAMHGAVSVLGSSAGKTSLADKIGVTNLEGEDLIVAYPMENTLIPSLSHLYYHATGIAIEGYYYYGGLGGTPKRYVYFGYLRHQGEGSSYDMETTNSTTEISPSKTTPMNIGIVRNNIYRVWIGSIDQKGEMKLKIKVKKWDKFKHEILYM